MILALDFDGTICEHDYPNIGAERELAIYVIKCLLQHGHEVIIWTCRTGNREMEAKDWLNQRGVFPTTINKNTVNNLCMFHGVDNRKVFANMYVDDKSFPPFTDWDDLLKYLCDNGILPKSCNEGKLPLFSDIE